MGWKTFKASPTYIKLISYLYRLDDRTKRKFMQHYPKSSKTISRITKPLLNVYQIIFRGASKQIVLKRTGHKTQDFINYAVYKTVGWLDQLDTLIFFRGKPLQTHTCRVRGKGEKVIANCLTANGISYIYEQPLSLGESLIHPDFYLPVYGVYVEFWGMNRDDDHRKMRDRKISLYGQYHVPVITIHPNQLSKAVLSAELSRQLFILTGKTLPGLADKNQTEEGDHQTMTKPA